MGQEIGQQVEDFGAERDRRSGVAQLVALGIKGIVAEHVPHRLPLR
jgi:hypothetical protein